MLHNKRFSKNRFEGAKENFRHSKKLGQHFLAAPEILGEITELLPIKGKNVLEIGAGDGRLTEALAEAGAKVTALEIDAHLIALLKKRFSKNRRVKIVAESVLDFSFSPFKLIFGNIPYNLSTPILLKTLESDFEHALLMVQAEFGERLVARAGTKNYSRLSVMLQSKAKAEIVNFIPRECFYPIPEVDSLLLHITPRKKSEIVSLDEELVSALFQHPNQNLRKALKHSRHLLGEKKVKELAAKIRGDLLGKSARQLSLEELALLSSFVK